MNAYRTPPTSINVGGKEYQINTDFRIWLDFLSKTENRNVDEVVKSVLNFMKSQGLPICEETFEKVLNFYTCGKNHGGGHEDKKSKGKAVDFCKDEPLIFSAFWAQYGINIRKEPLHWWDFIAMFQGLSETHLIVKIMGIRTMDTSQLPKDTKKHYDELKKRYSLGERTQQHRNKSAKERDDAFLAKVRARAKEAGMYHE